MGQTRIVLDTINDMIHEHNIKKNELIKKYCDNPNLEKYYRNQMAVFDQKYEKKLRALIDAHIDYLKEKDPYGREPLWTAEAKKALFIQARQKLEQYEGEQFLQQLFRIVSDLSVNSLIDKPRWPSLKLDNMFHYFKSMFSNKSTYLDVVLKSNPKSSRDSK